MSKEEDFSVVGPRYEAEAIQERAVKNNKSDKRPWIAIFFLSLILVGCLAAPVISNHDPQYLELASTNQPPNLRFYFGTDTMGRDVYSMIWYGGRISLLIGICSAGISAILAVIYGSISGMASGKIDAVLMHILELFLSIPAILLILFVQAMLGQTSPIAIAFVIGITSWMNIAKVVRSEVRQLRNNEYVIASRFMGAGFFYILRKHLIPNYIPTIMFMVVTNVGAAIGTEATLSFLGIGLPVEIISWGSMLSLSQQALLTNSWWIIFIPGIFLVTTLVCITSIGNYIRKENYKKHSNL